MAAGAGAWFASAEAVRAVGLEVRGGGNEEKGRDGEDGLAGGQGDGCVEGAAFDGTGTDFDC